MSKAKGIKEVAYVDVRQAGGAQVSLGGKRQIGPVNWFDCAGGGQVVVDKRHIAYVGNMSNPHGTMIIDVKDPKRPKLLSTLSMPEGTHSHKVRVSGDIMVTNREALGQHARKGRSRRTAIPAASGSTTSPLPRSRSSSRTGTPR